jgi:hypothetical protein
MYFLSSVVLKDNEFKSRGRGDRPSVFVAKATHASSNRLLGDFESVGETVRCVARRISGISARLGRGGIHGGQLIVLRMLNWARRNASKWRHAIRDHIVRRLRRGISHD